MKFKILAVLILAFVLPVAVFAHPGNTDKNGGHTNSKTGEYHYHHGYPEHDHWDIDGDGDLDCPFTFYPTSSQPKPTIPTTTYEPIPSGTPEGLKRLREILSEPKVEIVDPNIWYIGGAAAIALLVGILIGKKK